MNWVLVCSVFSLSLFQCSNPIHSFNCTAVPTHCRHNTLYHCSTVQTQMYPMLCPINMTMCCGVPPLSSPKSLHSLHICIGIPAVCCSPPTASTPPSQSVGTKPAPFWRQICVLPESLLFPVRSCFVLPEHRLPSSTELPMDHSFLMQRKALCDFAWNSKSPNVD